MHMRSCVTPDGRFVFGIHKPVYQVVNLREKNNIEMLGMDRAGQPYSNNANFPENDVTEAGADWVYEIPNPFPFRGVTYICRRWADKTASAPERISLPESSRVSFMDAVRQWGGNGSPDEIIRLLPEPLQLSLAVTSTDAGDLIRLAAISCGFVFDEATGRPRGLLYIDDGRGSARPDIINSSLFEAVANNPCLPDDYKRVMVLRPGIQGNSEITAEWTAGDQHGHVFEYLRRNSYIPWGHFAANMADNSIRYRIADLSRDDVRGMRHLYYQRTYVRLAEMLGLDLPERRRTLSEEVLERLRCLVNEAIAAGSGGKPLFFDATVWGWNFGFDYAPTYYRLHASHQQIHQQYALSPAMVATPEQDRMPSFSSGDLVASFIQEYYQRTGRRFFENYLKAIFGNTRTDGRRGESSLVVHQDENVVLFVPKAQTSQWELQLMPLNPVGNILEADAGVRRSLDDAIYAAATALAGMGARMITTIEYSRRITSGDTDQRLLYSFLPRLPESPGAFSEAQFRWVNGHYPEDFAAACRLRLKR